MSSKRIVCSCAAMALVVAAGGWYAVATFPLPAAVQERVLTEIGPLESRPKAITPENPVPLACIRLTLRTRSKQQLSMRMPW